MGTRPNVLLLFSDQHTPAVMGCSADATARTPNLDRLAREGVVFDNAYCPSPICLPSRMSFLTAREPHAQACWTNQDILPSGIPTFAHSLGAAGYAPTLIGRLHSIGPDQLRGFSHREIGDHSTNWIGGRSHDLGVLDKANDPWRESLVASGPGQSAYELHDRDVTRAAVEHLKEFGRRRREGDNSEFALVVGWLLPHPPYVCRPDLFRSYEGRVPPPSIPVPADEHPHYAWWRSDRGIADASDDETMRARQAYYGLVTTVDGMVGELLLALDEAGLADDTLVIYTSDHGDHLGDRGLWWKSTLYDESAKVPLIIRWPGRVAPGQRRHAVVNLIDLAATILDTTSAPSLPNAQGRSFLPVIDDPAAPWIDETFCEYVNDGAPAWSGGRTVVSRMIRSGHFKLIYHHGHAPELFDLSATPTNASTWPACLTTLPFSPPSSTGSSRDGIPIELRRSRSSAERSTPCWPRGRGRCSLRICIDGTSDRKATGSKPRRRNCASFTRTGRTWNRRPRILVQRNE
jgi:choline-sulfatase